MNNPDGRSNLNGEESHVFDAGQQLQQQSLPGTSGAPFSGLSLTLPHQILALQRLFALNRNGVSGAAASAIPSAAMAQQNHQHSQQQYSQQHQSTTPTETNSSAVLLAPAVDTSVKSWFESPDKKPLRSGKWIPEEEEYAEILIELFNKGFIDDCENGTTLRLYLSRKLRCAPMRISKKYAGKGIGKIVYSHTGKIPVVLKGKLQHAEKKYLDAVGSIYGFCSSTFATPQLMATVMNNLLPRGLVVGTSGIQNSNNQVLSLNLGQPPSASPSLPSLQAAQTLRKQPDEPTKQLHESYLQALKQTGHQDLAAISSPVSTERIFSSLPLVNPHTCSLPQVCSFPVNQTPQPQSTPAVSKYPSPSDLSRSVLVVPGTCGGMQFLNSNGILSQLTHINHAQCINATSMALQAFRTNNVDANVLGSNQGARNAVPAVNNVNIASCGGMELAFTPEGHGLLVPSSVSRAQTVVNHDSFANKTSSGHSQSEQQIKLEEPDILSGFDRIIQASGNNSKSLSIGDEAEKSNAPLTTASFDDFQRFLVSHDVTVLEESPKIPETKPLANDYLALFSAESYAMFAEESAICPDQHAAYLASSTVKPTRRESFDVEKTLKMVSEHAFHGSSFERTDATQHDLLSELSPTRSTKTVKVSVPTLPAHGPLQSCRERDLTPVERFVGSYRANGNLSNVISDPSSANSGTESSSVYGSFKGSHTSESHGSDNTSSGLDNAFDSDEFNSDSASDDGHHRKKAKLHKTTAEHEESPSASSTNDLSFAQV